MELLDNYLFKYMLKLVSFKIKSTFGVDLIDVRKN